MLNITAVNAPNPKLQVFFDVAAGGKQLGRIVFELFQDTTPRCAENFRCQTLTLTRTLVLSLAL